MKKFLLCEMYPLRGYVLQFFTDSYSRERERERESHFRTVIALNNKVLIIIQYNYHIVQLFVRFGYHSTRSDTFGFANSIEHRGRLKNNV